MTVSTTEGGRKGWSPSMIDGGFGLRRQGPEAGLDRGEHPVGEPLVDGEVDAAGLEPGADGLAVGAENDHRPVDARGQGGPDDRFDDRRLPEGQEELLRPHPPGLARGQDDGPDHPPAPLSEPGPDPDELGGDADGDLLDRFRADVEPDRRVDAGPFARPSPSPSPGTRGA